MASVIKNQFFFPHPPETVWEYLTKSELMELWLMRNNFQPIAGIDFQFRTNPLPSLDFDGICHCRVLEVLPFKRLSYSWKCGPGEGRFTLDSVVVWRLEPTGNGTELFLEHSFSKNENVNLFNGFADGWIKHIKRIAESINTSQHGNTKA
ncbi:MAG: SRPBCC domain-containing protein [Puia sp.]|nr:SRPBCC domain-containing protein [Puia sp.]